MAMHDDRDRVSRLGTQAWLRVKREKSWHDWITIGEALQVGREWAMNQATTNKPEGKAYNMAFGEWLRKYKLDDMDKSDRSRLFDVMENLPAIEEWRVTLTLTQRLKLNHPNSVLKNWKAAFEPEKPKSAKPTLRDSVANLSEEVTGKNREIAELTDHITELESARLYSDGIGQLIRPLLDELRAAGDPETIGRLVDQLENLLQPLMPGRIDDDQNLHDRSPDA